MSYDIHPQQISLFESVEDRSSVGGGRRGDRHIFEHIISIQNLLGSWQEFVRNKRRRADVARFSVHLMDHLLGLHRDLRDKTYRHSGYYAFKINDPKPRHIHKASVRDRLLHHALYRALYLLFDHRFIHDSYSCRLEKGTHRAIDRFRDFTRKVSRNHTRTPWILKCDIRKFFANIDHSVLKNILQRDICDPNLLWLLGQVIDSFHTKDLEHVGLPLGNLTSQIFVNIYMNEFDQSVKHQLKVKHYIRYADDFVVIHDNRNYLESLIPKISEFLGERLKLSLHPQKVSIQTLASGVDFLGWVHFHRHCVLRSATKWRMYKRLGLKLSEASLKSYLGLLSHGNAHKLATKIRQF